MIVSERRLEDQMDVEYLGSLYRLRVSTPAAPAALAALATSTPPGLTLNFYRCVRQTVQYHGIDHGYFICIGGD